MTRLANELKSPLFAAAMIPAACESTDELVAFLVKSMTRSLVVMVLPRRASCGFDSISMMVCASLTRSLFETKMLLLVMTMLLPLASTLLLTTATATMCEGSACDLPVVDMVWREELSWLGIVLEGAASSDVIVTCMAAGRSAVTNDVKYMIAMVAAAIDVFML